MSRIVNFFTKWSDQRERTNGVRAIARIWLAALPPCGTRARNDTNGYTRLRTGKHHALDTKRYKASIVASEVNNEGKRPVRLLHVPWGITKFIADLTRIEVDKDELLQGRKEIAGLLDAPLADSIEDAVGGKMGAGEGLSGLIGLLLYCPPFGHLWFLC